MQHDPLRTAPLKSDPAAAVLSAPASLCLDFAGTRLELASDSARWLELVAERYGAFAVPGPPSFVVSYRVEDQEPPFELLAARRGSVTHDVVDHRPGGFSVEGPAYRAEVDLTRATASVCGPLSWYPIDRLLTILLPLVLSDTLILHAAALQDGDRAFVCAGPSGCGKSTLAGLLPENALCDELVAVRRRGPGWEVRSLPFWTARPGAARLAEIMLLRHGHYHRRRALTPVAGLRALQREVVWPLGSSEAVGMVFRNLTALLDSIPVVELEFCPRADVWAVIAGAA